MDIGKKINTGINISDQKPVVKIIPKSQTNDTDNIEIPTLVKMNYRAEEKITEEETKSSHVASETSSKPVKVIKVSESFGQSKEKIGGSKHEMGEKHLKFAKIDIYNPKYLEMLDNNTDRYTLIFKNLDLYSDQEVDTAFNSMAKQRIDDLLRMSGPKKLIGWVTECMKVIDPNNYKKTITVCKKYMTPIYDENNKIKLLRKLDPRLKRAKHLFRAKNEIVVNDLHVIVDELITKEEYEISEGSKILSWIENNLVYYGGSDSEYFGYMMFADLLSLQWKGHIFLAKAGITRRNVVTPQLVKLQHLTYQYNNPINTANLIIQMQTSNVKIPKEKDRLPETSKSMLASFENIREEANKILSLEYFICLQPQPRFMLYILKRFVVAWYADIDLIDTVTKVRLLINQYRARRDKKENLKWGVLPSIVIYLRYGAASFNRALSKVNFYLTNYIHTGWVGNEPDYFTKYNDLIYYSNGSPDAKRFFEHLPVSTKMEIYKPFTINPTAFFKYGEDIVTPYPEAYDRLQKLKYRSKFELERELEETGHVRVDDTETH